MPIHPSRPRRAVPDLGPAEPEQAVPMTPPRRARLMVKFTDRTWRLCWVTEWQRAGNGWIMHLAWGDWGTIRDDWHRHDPDRVVSWPPDGSSVPG